MSKGKQDISEYDHNYFMDVAISEAVIAGQRGDKPIAAILMHDNKIIGKMSNTWNTIVLL
jgi:tRNA(adenine34) deaminase